MKKFEIKEEFYLNDMKLKIISGSIHYFRSMPDSWEDKIIKLKALGANTIETYVPWNMHEYNEGDWNLENNLNLPYFLELATKHDMLIIVRFGPYICAEHDYGGFPWWLNNKEGIKFRCDNQIYLDEVEKYINKIVKVILPYCSKNGGNVILGQLENEYGSYANDKVYLKKLLTMIRGAGFEEKIATSDGTWGSMLENGNLFEEGILPTVNFGSKADFHFDYLSKYVNKPIPLMCMEYWCGWFSSWKSEKLITSDTNEVAKELDEILNRGSVNFYMFHGGTNFGVWAGANQDDEKGYTPDTTSYDYDALLDERGNITEKYKACKEVISKYVDIPTIDTDYIPSKSYSEINYVGSSDIFENNNFEFEYCAHPKSMEELGYGHGYVLYESKLTNINKIETIDLQGMADRALIFIDEKLVYENYRNENKTIELNSEVQEGSKLSILVESTGRVNYGKYFDKQQKGLWGGVFINNHYYQFGWKITKLPMTYNLFGNLDYNQPISNKPQCHKYQLFINNSEDIFDTYIDTTGYGKGYIFVNRFNIGRFWGVGPQYKIFVPSQLLNRGNNEIIIIESDGNTKDLKMTE